MTDSAALIRTAKRTAGNLDVHDAQAYARGCRSRAAGGRRLRRQARVQPTGAILVKSDSQQHSHEVTFTAVGSLVVLICDCESGRFRRNQYPVPCKHAVVAGDRLVREGLAVEDGALYRLAA